MTKFIRKLLGISEAAMLAVECPDCYVLHVPITRETAPYKEYCSAHREARIVRNAEALKHRAKSSVPFYEPLIDSVDPDGWNRFLEHRAAAQAARDAARAQQAQDILQSKERQESYKRYMYGAMQNTRPNASDSSDEFMTRLIRAQQQARAGKDHTDL